MRIDYQVREIESATAGSEDSGYPAENVMYREIETPWRSETAGGTTLSLTLSGSATRLWIQHTNILAATVGGQPVTFSTEPNGRRKGQIAVSGSSVSISIAAGSPTEGWWYIGAIYAFGASVTLTKAPDYGLRRERVTPAISTALPNGRIARARSGPPYTRLSGRFRHDWTDDHEAVKRLCQAYGIIGVDLGLTARPDLAWPMEYVADSYEVSLPDAWLEETPLEMVEVV